MSAEKRQARLSRRGLLGLAGAGIVGAAIEESVWVADHDDAAWMTGGSYLVARKIRMTIETWDRTSLREQETLVGRTKGEGAKEGRPIGATLFD